MTFLRVGGDFLRKIKLILLVIKTFKYCNALYNITIEPI